MNPLEQFERFLQGEHSKSAATRAAYLADAHLLLTLLNDRPLDGLTIQDARGLVRQMRMRGDDPASIARRLSAWRAWFRVLVRDNGYASNPFDAIKAPKRARKLPRPLGPDATQQFLDAMPNEDILSARDTAIFELIYSAGLRVSELTGINLGDFRDGGLCVQVLGKGGKYRIVPVGSKARAALDHWLVGRATLLNGEEQALFLGQRGQRLSIRSVQARLAQWGVQAGVADQLHPHKLRHACASHFLQSSQDLRATQELLGHASIASTQVYTHLDFQHLASVYDAAHPRAKRDDSDAT